MDNARRRCKRELERACERWKSTLRFMRLMWLWSLGQQEIMQFAWEDQKWKNDSVFEEDNVDLDAMIEQVQSEFENNLLEDAEVIFLTYPQGSSAVKVWLQAWRFFVEWKLARHVLHINLAKGVPMPADKMLLKHANLLAGMEETIPDYLCETVLQWWYQKSNNARTIWLHRWRLNWEFMHGHLTPYSYVPKSELEKKANASKTNAMGGNTF